MDAKKTPASEKQIDEDSIAVSVSSFGHLPDGTEAKLFTLQNEDIILTLTTFGARVVSLLTKDREGMFSDVSLGHNDVTPYTKDLNAFFGATIGRFSNRIARGEFALDDKRYKLPVNNGGNTLHGGVKGFDQHNWSATTLTNGVTFSLTSPDGDQGFPGNLQVESTYTLQGSSVALTYVARSDQTTIVNLTNHTYFNLGGEGSPTVLDHELMLFSDFFTPIDATLIPTGESMPVVGTPFDFSKFVVLRGIIYTPHPQLQIAKGYDHNFIVRGSQNELRPAARLRHVGNGRTLDVFTTQPGVQFYSGNFLDGTLVGKSGRPYPARSGLCLETQHYPDSPNHPEFPSTVLLPGDTFTSTTFWRFGLS